MANNAELEISCLCGAVAQAVKLRIDQPAGNLPDLKLCHCTTCRHTTGLLCTSYYPVERPKSLEGLAQVNTGPNTIRYFCNSCGCHVFRCHMGDDAWEVASGVITASPDESLAGGKGVSTPGNMHVDDTKDGGISIWLPDASQELVAERQTMARIDHVLRGACFCGNVRFQVSPPNEESKIPNSGFPDLMYAYNTSDPDFIRNPDDVKWWLRRDGTRYLAGLCACRSCRLVSGFEIQTWAFIPRYNISFEIAQKGQAEPEQTHSAPLNFGTLPKGILRSYESSPGVLREFCPLCGATVFWHDKWRPELMDVSVGLLDATEGARAEGWLDWWTGRVSFAEDAPMQRRGFVANRAKNLVRVLEEGLQRSAL